ncbi:hypothetical protein DL89DRAFT_267589 [Linderina pennispora]|uniref:Uncharacterized protein n=1 Tax=Linderina pennispora TaxID=61395 RepID=A0A1Y1W747_9FUNG|nr:uncharacterized protein DL89DRAFT_267589 [Linderina pennispora]ORX69359.1 hypothetical protein DL89DRAFT_267589 [Linderina pennispora]
MEYQPARMLSRVKVKDPPDLPNSYNSCTSAVATCAAQHPATGPGGIPTITTFPGHLKVTTPHYPVPDSTRQDFHGGVYGHEK